MLQTESFIAFIAETSLGRVGLVPNSPALAANGISTCSGSRFAESAGRCALLRETTDYGLAAR